jgi:hypothetical protein
MQLLVRSHVILRGPACNALVSEVVSQCFHRYLKRRCRGQSLRDVQEWLPFGARWFSGVRTLNIINYNTYANHRYKCKYVYCAIHVFIFKYICLWPKTNCLSSVALGELIRILSCIIKVVLTPTLYGIVYIYIHLLIYIYIYIYTYVFGPRKSGLSSVALGELIRILSCVIKVVLALANASAMVTARWSCDILLIVAQENTYST